MKNLKIFSIICSWIQLSLTCLICNCGSLSLSGGGSETVALVTGSHSVSGKIVAADPIDNNYSISIYSSGYSPLEYSDTTNYSDTVTPSSDGLFVFSNLKSGHYNLLISNLDLLKTVMIKDVQIDSVTHNFEDTLREPGRFILTADSISVPAIAYLEGTPFVSVMKNHTQFTFATVPQGNYFVFIVKQGETSPGRSPMDTTIITIEKGKTNNRSIIISEN